MEFGGSGSGVGGTLAICAPDPAALAAAHELGLVGCSDAHRAAISRLSKVAPTGVEILITGPTGVGKELYAQFAHRCSARRNSGEFVAINCGAVPEGLFENELFGHGAGAFTGAGRCADGLVAAAEGGTLFLDEVDTLGPGAQVKLLRFLEQREYRRLGEVRVRRSNVSVIAATNADLGGRVRAGQFREDLFFRLRVVSVEVLPLRLRREDIPVLLTAAVRRAATRYGLPPVVFAPGATQRLLCYGWPGNVRELQNMVRALTCQQLGRPVAIGDLPLLDDRWVWSMPTAAGVRDPLLPLIRADSGASPQRSEPVAGGGGGRVPARDGQSLQEAKRQALDQFEREFVQDALRTTGGNIAAAARIAGKHRRAFFELMRKHHIAAEPFRSRGDWAATEPPPAARPGANGEAWDAASRPPANIPGLRQGTYTDRL